MKTIRHTATLYFYDGPQVFEARDGIGGHYVAVLVEPEGGLDRFLVAGVAPERLRQFRSGAIDLRSLLLEGSEGEWFLATAEAGWDQPLELIPQNTSLGMSSLLPDAGFVLPSSSAETLAGVSNLGAQAVKLEGALENADAVSGIWRLAASQGVYAGRTKEGGPSLRGLQIGGIYRFNCLEEVEEIEETGREQRTLYLAQYEPL